MSTDSKARGLQGFLVGALVAGAVAAGIFLSKPPEQVPSGPSVPMAAPTLAPVEPLVPAEAPAPASPREAADLLFNEAMVASEQGDQGRLAQVLPGAIAAYRSLGELDADETYHLALLAEARAACASLLAKNPNHLLGLGVSLRVAMKANDASAARAFGQRLLKAYDIEAARPLPEYQDHQRVLAILRAEAMAAAK